MTKKSSARCLALVCSALLLVSAVARAQVVPDTPSYLLHHGVDGKWVECDGKVDCARTPGKRGVWFELELAQHLTEGHRALPAMQAELRATTTKVGLVEERLKICQDALNLADAESHGMDAAIEDAVFQQRLAEEKAADAIASRDAWYNGKLLWYSAGLLTAVVVLGAAVVVAN